MFAALHVHNASNVHSVSHSSRVLALLGTVWRRPTRPDARAIAGDRLRDARVESSASEER